MKFLSEAFRFTWKMRTFLDRSNRFKNSIFEFVGSLTNWVSNPKISYTPTPFYSKNGMSYVTEAIFLIQATNPKKGLLCSYLPYPRGYPDPKSLILARLDLFDLPFPFFRFSRGDQSLLGLLKPRNFLYR